MGIRRCYSVETSNVICFQEIAFVCYDVVQCGKPKCEFSKNASVLQVALRICKNIPAEAVAKAEAEEAAEAASPTLQPPEAEAGVEPRVSKDVPRDVKAELNKAAGTVHPFMHEEVLRYACVPVLTVPSGRTVRLVTVVSY